MHILTLPLGDYQTNCYILYCKSQKEAIVIDPGFEGDKIINTLNKYDLTVEAIIATHGHGDHIGAIPKLKDYYPKAELMIGFKDQDHLKDCRLSLINLMGGEISLQADRLLHEGDLIEVGDLILHVLETPGHTQGGISLWTDGHVFVGDSLFLGDVGRTDLPGGSFETLERSIREKLYVLPEKTRVYPGHGPATSIGREKKGNHFVREVL